MIEASIGNSELISEVNTRLVLQAVRRMQPTYRAEVARVTNLKPATVTSIVNALLSKKMLRSISGSIESGPRGGRPPMMLQVNADSQHVLAIDLEPDCIRVALSNLLAEPLVYREQLIDRFSEPAIIIRQICNLCEHVLQGIDRKKLLGTGMSLPGLIDKENGILISSTNMPKWHNVRIRDHLKRQIGVTPRVERSAHLAALYEGWCSRDRSEHTTLILSLRTGIGMSMIRHGELYSGLHGFDGEIGHTVIDVNGRDCECGSRGCLETFVSAAAVCERIESMIKDGRCAAISRALADGERLRPELAYRLAKEGDTDCIEIVRDVGRYIGIAASNMINLLAPNRLVLCGAIDTADDLLLEAVRDQINQHALPKLRENLVVGLAVAKEKSPLLGAAALVARQLFELPRLRHPTEAVAAGAVASIPDSLQPSEIVAASHHS